MKETDLLSDTFRYINYSRDFYDSHNFSSFDELGLPRTLESFHLVDMYPTIKAMERFPKNLNLGDFFKDDNHLEFGPASIYIHFPFCKAMCSYCHIYKESFFRLGNLEDVYISCLEKEIKMYSRVSEQKIPIKSIYFGGGTPSVMKVESLEVILKALKNTFDIPEDSFISFEIYPGVNFNRSELCSKLEILKNFGVKEIVLDLQSTNQESLKDVGRGSTSLASWREIIKLIKSCGISRIKTSLIIGLPYDTLEKFQSSVFEISNTDEVSTISLFLLEFRKGLRIYDDLLNNPKKFPDAAERDKMLILARKILIDNGFVESPVHFFTRKKYLESKIVKPSLIGVNDNHLFGFGPSAYGHIICKNKAIKYFNYADIHKYIESINKLEMPISRWYQLDSGDRALSELIDGISSNGVIDKKLFYEKYGMDVNKKFGKIISVFQTLGLMEDNEDKVIISEAGKIRLEEILWYFYPENYKDIQREPEKIEDKELSMHNYVTVISKDDESNFLKPINQN